MNFNKLYIALLSVIITFLVMFMIDVMDLSHPITETIREINQIFDF